MSSSSNSKSKRHIVFGTFFKRLFFLSLIIFVMGAFLIRTVFLADAQTATHTFSAAADSYVQSGSPTGNYGTSTQVRLDGSPLVVTYLRFNVLNVSGTITNASLKIYANSKQSGGFTVHSVADAAWQEAGIIYNNAPPYSTSAISSSGPLAAGTWYTVPVTSAISGNGTYSFALVTTNQTAVSLGSRESANPPQLIVEAVSDGTPLPTSIITPTTILSPTSFLTPTSFPTPTSVIPSPTSTPGPPPSGDPVIAAVGDMVCGAASGGAACKQMEVSDLILNMNPVAYLALGDVQYEKGEYSDFIKYYEPSYGRFKNITKPAIGNHEYNDPAGSSDPSKVGYWDYYNGIGNYSGIGGDRDKGYYSFNIGNWHLIALNSNCSKVGGCSSGSPQNTWLRQDLAANTKPCTLAFFHHPLFSSGGRASTGVKPFWELLDQYGAEVILAGHDHTYERFSPMNANGVVNNQYGIRSFVVGSGGRNHTHLVTNAPNSEVFDDTSYGALKMTLHNNSYDWEFVPIPGNSYTDRGTGTCHGAPGTVPTGQPSPTPTSVTPTSTPSVSPTGTGPVITLNAASDASVFSASPAVNYGSAATLETDNSPQKRFYMRFNVSGLTGPVSNAKIRLYNVNASNSGGGVRKVLSSSWMENTISWNNAPAVESQILSTVSKVSIGRWYEFNVTSAVSGNGTYDFAVITSSSDGADYSSREGANPPQLVITQ